MLEDNTLYFSLLQEPFYRKDISYRFTAVRIECITDLRAVNKAPREVNIFGIDLYINRPERREHRAFCPVADLENHPGCNVSVADDDRLGFFFY